MSKAFTKEDSDAGDEPGPDEGEGSPLPAGSRNYLTPAGNARLRAELHQLLHTERPTLVQTVSWAAGNGDRSENGDYIYGKRRLREIDRRIRFLTKRLESAEVVNPAEQKGDRVLFGAQVLVADEDGRERRFQIVGVDEIDAARGKVSWLSPVAKALLNSRAGDVVVLTTPKGDEELEVLRVIYEGDGT